MITNTCNHEVTNTCTCFVVSCKSIKSLYACLYCTLEDLLRLKRCVNDKLLHLGQEL